MGFLGSGTTKIHELYAEFGNVLIYFAIAMPTRKFCSVSEYQPAATGYPLKGPGPKEFLLWLRARPSKILIQQYWRQYWRPLVVMD